ncbi:MAG: hypothetical protein IKJ88_05775 [Clostridia bacterium]|nr:hypothetical protein [Clostridia bacterium]
MKKFLAIFVSLLMVLSFAACSEKEPVSNNETTTNDNAPVVSDGEITTPLFTLKYDESVWTYYPDETASDEDRCAVTLQIPDPDDSDYYLVNVDIKANIDEPYDFREDLVYYGFNQYEYKENNEYEFTEIGGVELLKYDDGDDTLMYFNRIENAGATVVIDFDATDINDSRLSELLEGLTFTLADTGNVDGPWEWEGEPFSAEKASVSAGDFTIEAEFVPFEAPVTTFETFDHSVAAIGDKVYVLVDGELSVCHYDGTVLAFVNKIELPEDDYDRIEATDDGVLWVSGSMNDVLCIKDGNIVATYEDIDSLAIHPSGIWGVSFFVSNECEIVTFSGDTYTSTPVKFEEADTIMHLCGDENNIYVCASAADESGHKVFVYDKSGALQKTLCDAEGEGLGSVTYITQTENGYIGFDGNMRDVLVWDNDGKFIAEISDGDLFSTGYPWFCDSAVMDDESIITIMTDEREDRSATELVVFIVKGF